MATAQTFPPSRLVVGILIARRALLGALLTELEHRYGPMLCASTIRAFNESDYYDREMGGRPLRLWVAFEATVDPSLLAAIKGETNALEQRFLNDAGGREVNLDPGMLSLTNLVLATAKGRAHRIALADGIWGDLTLIWSAGSFVPLQWTYADYRDEGVRELFSQWRATLKQR
jgi:hypothetical protein